MKELKLVIFDEDYMYVESLLNFFNKNYSEYFMSIGITNKEDFNYYVRAGKTIDILLINNDSKKYIDELNLFKVVITLIEQPVNNDIEQRAVFKYQNGQSIFNCISKIYSELRESDMFNSRLIETETIAFFSPSGGVGTSIISLLFANGLTKQGYKVLFLDINEISNLQLIFKNTSTNLGLTDLLYKSNEKIIIDKKTLSTFINKNEITKIYFINPLNSVIDKEVLKEEDIINVIDTIKQEFDFDFIIVDTSITMDKSIAFINNYVNRAFGIVDYTLKSFYKMTKFLEEMVDIKNIDIIINKVKREEISIINKELNICNKKIYELINYDNNLDNFEINVHLITKSVSINSDINDILYKFLREEFIDE